MKISALGIFAKCSILETRQTYISCIPNRTGSIENKNCGSPLGSLSSAICLY